MMRIASQLTFCSPDEIMRRAVVELDEQKIITRLFSLDGNAVESAQTLFYDGILSAEIISVKEQVSMLDNLASEYNYIDLSLGIPTEIVASEKPLLLDFGTHSPEKINQIFAGLTQVISAFSIFEIIAACCYYPALVVGEGASLSANRKTKILLWEGSDLVNKRITKQTRIRGIS
ncbi:MAG TPA: hypothetical protein VFK73_09820 [Paludibacter sp.]|nr:hypothetical protein [Paludibacter sp.]